MNIYTYTARGLTVALFCGFGGGIKSGSNRLFIQSRRAGLSGCRLSRRLGVIAWAVARVVALGRCLYGVRAGARSMGFIFGFFKIGVSFVYFM